VDVGIQGIVAREDVYRILSEEKMQDFMGTVIKMITRRFNMYQMVIYLDGASGMVTTWCPSGSAMRRRLFLTR